LTSAATRTAEEIATACGGRLVGEPSRVLRGVRSLEAAGPEDAAFVAARRDERHASGSLAGLLLARAAGLFPGRDVVEVARPELAIADVLLLFHPPRIVRPGVHPTAVLGEGALVDPSAEVGPYVVIGAGSRVGPGCFLEAQVVIGAACTLGERVRLHPHVTLYDGVTLGAGVEIHSGAVIGADGFGYEATPSGIRKVPQVGGVAIDADVEIGANSCVDRATLETTRVGAGTKIDDLVMVGHNSVIGKHGFLCAQAGLAGSTTMGDGVIIAGQVGVAGHLRIGNGVKVGAQSGISGDVPDGDTVSGSPHMNHRQWMRMSAELRSLPETARLVRRLAAAAGFKLKEGA
jgi:UDP-3-O-[3-hydroxymyristoyl] glucosamine N-acyltransferase